MLLRRRILLLLVLVFVPGSLSVTLGYGLYLRSDAYRARLEQEVSELLHFPTSIERVRTLTGSSRAFQEISVRMPARGDHVFRCRRAVWSEESRNGRPWYALDLIDGWLLVGTHQWSPEDYRAMLQSGFGQDFVSLSLRRVHLANIDLEWRHPAITLSLRDSVGEIVFDEDGTGRASLVCHNLNGCAVEQAINVIAHFTPGAGLRFHEAELQLPPLPLGGLGLNSLLRAEVTRGVFQGELRYRVADARERVALTGAITGAALEELTEPVIGGPFHGRVNVIVDEAVFLDRRLEGLRFRGRLSDLRVNELVPVLRTAPLDSRVQLRVHQASLRGTAVEYLSADGYGTDLSLEALTGLIGRGRISGRLRVEIRGLQIVDDRLVRAEVELTAVPPDGAPGTIDKSLLEWAAREIVGIEVGRILPERIEYAELGVRLVIDGEVLHVRGTHGQDGRTILTMRLFGRQVPLIREFDRAYEIGPLLARIREQIETYNMERFRRWWESVHQPPETPQ